MPLCPTHKLLDLEKLPRMNIYVPFREIRFFKIPSISGKAPMVRGLLNRGLAGIPEMMPGKQPPAPCMHFDVCVTHRDCGVSQSHSLLQPSLYRPLSCSARASWRNGAFCRRTASVPRRSAQTPARLVPRCSEGSAAGALGALDVPPVSLFGGCGMASPEGGGELGREGLVEGGSGEESSRC